MINITDIKTNILTDTGLFAECYDISSNIPCLLGKTYIKPYREEMKKDVNNVILFLDAEHNITGGQIGKYNYDKGIHVIMFTGN
jgi:hypothetical protein